MKINFNFTMNRKHAVVNAIHSGKRRCRNNKGVSTVVGMAIFLLLFAIAVSYVFTWTQDQGNLVDTIRQQTDTDKNRLSENLVVIAHSNTELNVTNPTSQAAVVVQIWSNHTLLSSPGMTQGIPPYGSYYFNFTGSSAAANANGNFTVVTLAGNIFSGGIQSEFAEATAQTWQVAWYFNNSTGLPTLPSTFLGSSTQIAVSYWYTLNFDWEWAVNSNPVVANYNLSSAPYPPYDTIGFIANTTIMKTSGPSSNVTINCYNDSWSMVQISIDNGSPQTPTNGVISFSNGTQYSIHTITVYYYTDTNSTYLNGNINNPEIALLRLNIVNATFVP
jgi:hypothetical protein